MVEAGTLGREVLDVVANKGGKSSADRLEGTMKEGTRLCVDAAEGDGEVDAGTSASGMLGTRSEAAIEVASSSSRSPSAFVHGRFEGDSWPNLEGNGDTPTSASDAGRVAVGVPNADSELKSLHEALQGSVSQPDVGSPTKLVLAPISDGGPRGEGASLASMDAADEASIGVATSGSEARRVARADADKVEMFGEMLV